VNNILLFCLTENCEESSNKALTATGKASTAGNELNIFNMFLISLIIFDGN